MRIFITGCTGFVGRHVVREVCAGNHNVLALTRTNLPSELSALDIQYVCGTVGDVASVKSGIISFDPEVVIHLAWQGIPDFTEHISQQNLNDSIALLDCVLEETHCQKVIVAGSCYEYGKTWGECNESDPVQLGSFFSWAKHSLYQYLTLKCALKDIELNWFRIFYAYGSGQRSGSLIPTLVQAFQHDQVPDIRSPLNKNDYVFIEDIAKAFRLAVDTRAATGIYNLGCGTSSSVYEICKIVETCLQKDSKISDTILKGGSGAGSVDFWSNTEKMAKNFGWQSDVTLEEGIAKYIASLSF
jgi:UDP-glucose 4-epimerase